MFFLKIIFCIFFLSFIVFLYLTYCETFILLFSLPPIFLIVKFCYQGRSLYFEFRKENFFCYDVIQNSNFIGILDKNEILNARCFEKYVPSADGFGLSSFLKLTVTSEAWTSSEKIVSYSQKICHLADLKQKRNELIFLAPRWANLKNKLSEWYEERK